MKNQTLTISKLDAARRHLRTAIWLWFADGDPVAVHTLASAAHEIIHTLFRRKGLHGLMFDSRMVKEEYRSDWAKLIKKHATFFKHAQRDAEDTIEFNPLINEGVLLAAAHGLSRMGEPPGLEETAFGWWTRIHHPGWFPKIERGGGIQVDPFERLKALGKDEFFQAFQLLWREGRAPGQTI